MVTNNAINLSSAGLCRYDGAGTFTGVTVTQHDVLIGAASNGITSLALTNGQLAIGSSGSDPSAATLSPGTGITIANGAGSITINSVGGGLTWNDVTGGSASGAPNNGYLADAAGLTTISLPAAAAQFDVFAIAGWGSGGWKLTQASGQQIELGSSATTSGATGFIASTNRYDCVYLICTVSPTNFTVLNSVGNITVS